jgi:hypothetical protein
MELPAAARAPKRDAPIYTASAPWSIAAIPHSKFLAGAKSSRVRIMLYIMYLFYLIVEHSASDGDKLHEAKKSYPKEYTCGTYVDVL